MTKKIKKIHLTNRRKSRRTRGGGKTIQMLRAAKKMRRMQELLGPDSLAMELPYVPEEISNDAGFVGRTAGVVEAPQDLSPRDELPKTDFSPEFQFLGKLKQNQKIVFLVNGARIGMFKYKKQNPPAFVMENTRKEMCIAILCYPDAIYLSDYFYYAKINDYSCANKPSDIPEHQNILVHLLNFLAHAYNVKTINLSDASTKDINRCLSIPSHVYLVAGKGGFYKKVAGFENDKIEKAAKKAGKMKGPDGWTLQNTAQELLDECAENIVYREDEMTLIKNALEEQMTKIGTTFKYSRRPPRNPDTFRALEADTVDGDREKIDDGEVLKEYVFVDILPLPRRSAKKRV